MSSKNECEINSAIYGKGAPHIYDIPVEWKHDNEENIGGDYAKAVIILEMTHVSVLSCKCGAEIERGRLGERKIHE